MSHVGTHCRAQDRAGQVRRVFVLAKEGTSTYHSLLVEDSNLLVDYVVHKITGPLLEEKIVGHEAALAEARALAEEGKRILGVEGDIEEYIYVFKAGTGYGNITQDYEREGYWEVSEESSEDYDYEEESE